MCSRFDLLGDSEPNEVMTPPIFMAFDCLYRDGRNLRQQALSERRKALEGPSAEGHGMVFTTMELPERQDRSGTGDTSLVHSRHTTMRNQGAKHWPTTAVAS